jgi:hypothetical protein
MTKQGEHAIEDSLAPPPEESLTLLATALCQRRFLLVWADVPFPPTEQPPRNPALAINRWQEEALALPPSPFDFFHGRPWPLVQMPPLPILSLDPSDRLERAFRYAGVPLHTVRTRRDLPRPDQHNLFKLGGDLAARAGLFLSWEDVGTASSDPDKAHLLQEVGNQVEDGAVLVVAPSPTAAFARLWRSLLAPTLQVATYHCALGPADFAWPAPLQWLDGELDHILSALADLVPPLPLEPAQADPLRRQLAEARVNLQLIEEREAEYVLSTDVPLQLVKEKRRWQQRITELEGQLADAGVPARESTAVPADSLSTEEIQAFHAKLDRLLAGQEGLRQGQAAVYRRLDNAQRRTVEEVLAGLREVQLGDADSARELRAMVDGIRRALIHVQSRQLPELDAEVRRVLDEMTEVVRVDADLRTGLELAIPLVPLLLSYKIDLDLGGGLDLRQLWENLVDWIQRQE